MSQMLKKTAAIMLFCCASAQAALLKGPVYLQWPDMPDSQAYPLKYKGKGNYAVTVRLEKGSYPIQLADAARSCGQTFGPEQSQRLMFNQPLPLNNCAKQSRYQLKILFPGEYQFSLNYSDAEQPTLKVLRQPKASSHKRQPPAVACIQWDGKPVTTEVGSVFAEGEQVRDFYSGQIATVKQGKVTLQPAQGSGGVLLLEAANSQPSSFSWDNASVYFMVTDRFNNGDSSNDLPLNRKRDGKQETGTFQGGDFAGVIDKLDYLQQLGVNAIWVTPIVEQVHGFVGGGEKGSFPFYGYHGYWALDFTRIDPNLGSEEDFGRFVDAAHQRGIRVLVDVVMNHAGYPTLQDMQTFGINALAPRAPVPDNWHEWQPDKQKGQNWHRYNNYIRWSSPQWAEKWWGPDWVRSGMAGYQRPGGDDVTMNLAGLPDFLTESNKAVGLPPILKNKPDTRAVERQGYSVVDYLVEWHTDWVRRYGIDGFRADTVKHVEPEVWVKLKTAASQALAEWKAEYPEKKLDDLPFWMVGEVWHHGAYRDLYFDHGMDSLINFAYADEMQAVKAGVCLAQNETLYADYANSINRDPSFNLLTYISSHDTKLFYQRYQDLTLQAGAGTALLLLPGGVQIYYGDESARPAGPQTDAFDSPTRSFMNWQQLHTPERQALLKHWQTLGQFRNRHLAIGAGSHQMLSEQPYAFSRVKGEDRVVVVFAGKP